MKLRNSLNEERIENERGIKEREREREELVKGSVRQEAKVWEL